MPATTCVGLWSGRARPPGVKLRRLPTHGEPLGLVLPWSRSVSEGENSRGDCVVNTSRPPESKSECGVRCDGCLQTVARPSRPVYTADLRPSIGGGLHRPTGAARLKRERGAKPLRSRHCDGRGAIADATHAARKRGEGASARSSPQSGDLPWAETSVAPRGVGAEATMQAVSNPSRAFPPEASHSRGSKRGAARCSAARRDAARLFSPVRGPAAGG